MNALGKKMMMNQYARVAQCPNTSYILYTKSNALFKRCYNQRSFYSILILHPTIITTPSPLGDHHLKPAIVGRGEGVLCELEQVFPPVVDSGREGEIQIENELRHYCAELVVCKLFPETCGSHKERCELLYQLCLLWFRQVSGLMMAGAGELE